MSKECKEAFKQAGIDYDEKDEPEPDLYAALKPHLDLLPQEVKALVEKQPVKEEKETDVTKKLNLAVGQIRDQSTKKQNLQQKADQAKATYKIYLEELKQVNESIEQTQKELETLAKSFGSMLKDEPPEEKTPRSNGGCAMEDEFAMDVCHNALATVGVTLTMEQKTQLDAAWAEQLKKKRKVGSPGPRG